jgi:peptidoglycan hydrolase CwlO-like protein
MQTVKPDTDESERRQGEGSRVTERHFQTFLLSVVVLMLGGVGSLIVEMIVDMGKFSTKLVEADGKFSTHLAQIDERITALQTQIVATYRTSDAQRDVAETTRQIDALKQRVGAIESAINGRKTTPELQAWSRK